MERSQDHAITGPPFQVLPSASFCFPSIHILADFGNNKLRLRDGGVEETGGNATSEKGTRPLIMKAGHQLRAIEELSVFYMIREMATSI